MNSLKEKLFGTLGAFGIILFFIIRIVICILPFVIIGGGVLFTFILIIIDYIFPISTIVFWIWGFVCAIKGPQDIFAIIYYIAFAVLWLPFYISMITSFFKRNE